MTLCGHWFLLRCLVCLDATANDPFTDSILHLTLNLYLLRSATYWRLCRVMNSSSSFLPFSVFIVVSPPKLGFSRNLFVFQNINFTFSLLSSLTMRKLCNEGVIKLGAVWECQTSERKKEQSRRRHLSFYRVYALHGPDAHVHVLNVSFMMSGLQVGDASDERWEEMRWHGLNHCSSPGRGSFGTSRPLTATKLCFMSFCIRHLKGRQFV